MAGKSQEIKKPFDLLAEGLFLNLSRGDGPSVELVQGGLAPYFPVHRSPFILVGTRLALQYA